MERDLNPTDWSRDGRWITGQSVQSSPSQIWVVPMLGDRKPFAFLETPLQPCQR
jgi:hypothetical protein